MDPKKELLNYPPKQRDITHLKKTNILNMEGEEASPVKQKPKENLFKKLQEDELKEQKIRLTATNTSNLFSEKQHNELSKGIRTYPNPETRHIPDRKVNENPHKHKDQPINSFYPNNSKNHQSLNNYQVHVSKKNKKNEYFDKNKEQIVELNVKEKKFEDITSDILHLKDKKECLDPNYKCDLQNAFASWEDNIYDGQQKTKVNEKASFERDYSKKMRMNDRISYPITEQKEYQTDQTQKDYIKPIEKQNNLENTLRQQAKRKKARSISPAMMWTSYDSVRNKYDSSQQEERDSTVKSTSFANYKDKKLSGEFVLCEKSSKLLKGQLRSDNNGAHEVPKIGQGKSTQYRSTQNDKEFSGIYKWKNNYKKKK